MECENIKQSIAQDVKGKELNFSINYDVITIDLMNTTYMSKSYLPFALQKLTFPCTENDHKEMHMPTPGMFLSLGRFVQKVQKC